MDTQTGKTTFWEQIKYNKSEWFNIFLFTALSYIFKWNVADVGWSAWIYFFISMLLTLRLNTPKILKSIKSHEEETGKSLGIFGCTILSAIFIWLLAMPAILIYIVAPLPQGAREFVFTSFISELFRNYWSVIVVAVISNIFEKSKTTENNPFLQLGPLVILSFFMFMAQGIIHSQNIFIRFVVYIFAFFPFKDPNIDKKGKTEKC
jgi:uncharacterized membrane protein